MRMRRRTGAALVSAVAGVASLALATPAWATGTLAPQRSEVIAALADPPGANGTVKIDGVAFDDGIDNEPHVHCEFQVDFFNFDKDEHANIVFTIHPPSGSGAELLRRDNVLVSDDEASGGKPDPDKSFTFSAADLGLGKYTAHPKQGYHVKLTIERIGAPGAGKHKVFWIGPCDESSATTPPATATPEAPAAGGENGGAGASDSSLPLTGPAVGGIALLGTALVGGGAALLIVRRRRKITFTS